MAEFLSRFWAKMRTVTPLDKIDGTEALPVVHAINTRSLRVDQIISLALERFKALPVTPVPAVPVMPTGTIVATMGPVPAGWLKCDGSAISRTQYAKLFGVIGTGHGAGDGKTTFALPDIHTRLTLGNKPDATWIIAI